jgi:hypothetical protein
MKNAHPWRKARMAEWAWSCHTPSLLVCAICTVMINTMAEKHNNIQKQVNNGFCCKRHSGWPATWSVVSTASDNDATTKWKPHKAYDSLWRCCLYKRVCSSLKSSTNYQPSLRQPKQKIQSEMKPYEFVNKEMPRCMDTYKGCKLLF